MLETTLCYLSVKGKTLMLFRNQKKEDLNKGKWLGIGGKIEEGETPEACMLREFQEETGMKLTKYSYRGIVEFIQEKKKKKMHLFTASEADGRMHSCDEGELSWIENEKILDLSLWEGDRIFLRILAEEVPFFELKLFYDLNGHLLKAVLDGQLLSLPFSHA